MHSILKYFQEVLSPKVLIRFVPIALLLFAESIVFKAIQVHRLSGGVAIDQVIRGIAADIVFVELMVFVFATLYLRGSKWQRCITEGVYYLVMTYAFIITTASHGYFLSTGSTLPWSTIQYWFGNMAITNEIIVSSGAGWKVTVIGVQVLLIIVAYILPKMVFVKTRLENKKTPSITSTKAILITSLVILVGSLFIPAPTGRNMVVSRSVPVNIVTGAFKEMFLGLSSVEIADEERQDGALRFKSREGAPRPNVVFIIFESLNWKTSDIHTPGIGTTPFLKQLAPSSTVIEYPYTIIPHTTKAIMPLLCGIYPYFKTEALETTPGILPKRCMAHILRGIGYKTAFFQPAYNFENRRELVTNMGFQTYKGAKQLPQKGFEVTSYFGSEDKVMIEPSMDWVDSVKEEPFFLTYLTLATHHNYMTPQSFQSVDYKKSDKDLGNYMNAVRYVDDFIKEVFEEFEKRGLIDNTVFVIAGDHGEAFAEHARRQHDLIMWEEGLRTTALIYAPKLLPEHKVIKGIRSNLDFVPTVCDLLEMELEEGSFVGQSLLKPVPEDRKLFHSCWFNNECLAMHDGPVKTIYHYGSQPMEVYNNFEDPFELENLALTGSYDQDYLDKKKEELLRFKKVVDQEYREWAKATKKGKITLEKPKIEREISARFGDIVEIAGVEAPKSGVAGELIRLKYLFKRINKPSPADRLFVHVIHGKKFLNADHVPVGGTMPLHLWQPDHYIVDEHWVHIPSHWPEGKVKIYVGFWNRKTRKKHEIGDSSIPVRGERLLVATIPIKGSKQARTGPDGLTVEKTREKIKDWIGFEEPSYEKKMNVVFGDAVELRGVTLERMDVMLAGTVEMTYVFKATGSLRSTWRLTVKMKREDGFEINGDHTPIGGLYPTKYWRPDEYVVDQHRIHIDMYKSKVGTYGVWLGFRDGRKSVPATGEGEIDSLGRVRIGTVTISKKDARQ